MRAMLKFKKKIVNMSKVLILPCVIYIIFTIATKGAFGNTEQLISIFRQSINPMMVGMGMSMLMQMSMWDFSIGGIIYAAAIFGAAISQVTNTGVPGLAISAIGVALVMSAVSGVLYNYFKVPDMVLSIGLVMLYEVLPRLILNKSSGVVTISQKDGFLVQMPYIGIIFVLTFTVFYVVNKYSSLGFEVREIGANQEVAYKAGVNLPKTKFKAFMFGGFFFGLSGILTMSTSIRMSAASNLSSTEVIFDPMMGVFLAQFFTRYCDYSFGLLVGVFAMKMLGTGLVAIGVSSTIRSVATGIFLLIVLCFSSNQHLLNEYHMRKKVKEVAKMKA